MVQVAQRMIGARAVKQCMESWLGSTAVVHCISTDHYNGQPTQALRSHGAYETIGMLLEGTLPPVLHL